jgi:hypothetical protein
VETKSPMITLVRRKRKLPKGFMFTAIRLRLSDGEVLLVTLSWWRRFLKSLP